MWTVSTQISLRRRNSDNSSKTPVQAALLQLPQLISCYCSQPPPKHSEISPHAALLLLSQLISFTQRQKYGLALMIKLPYTILDLRLYSWTDVIPTVHGAQMEVIHEDID